MTVTGVGIAGMAVALAAMLWMLLPLVVTAVIIWVGWRYFDRRYKSGDHAESSAKLLTGDFEPTNEVFIDPKDGHKYRVYYNRRTGEREYVREQSAN